MKNVSKERVLIACDCVGEVMNKGTEEEIKKYSYKGEVKSIIVAVVTMIFGGLLLALCIYESDNIDDKIYCYFVSTVFIILGLLLLWLGVKALHNDRKLNKKLGGMAYKFDYEKEFKIYKTIGRVEKKQEKIHFEKYMEWKAYVEQQYIKLINNENFYRYINREYRNVKKEESVDKCIMIPIVLLMPQIMMSLNEWNFSEKFIIAFIVLIIVEVVLINKIYTDRDRIHFYEDFIEIIYPEKAIRK